MIASCWNWDSASYSYFFIPEKDLDAGGWAIPRGLEAKPKGSSTSQVSTFESALQSLPKTALFCGNGSECVGELYDLRDSSPRGELDIQQLKQSPDPSHRKVVQVLESDTESLRINEARSDAAPAPPKSDTRLLWEYSIPILTGLGAGVGLLQYTENLKLKSAFLVWIAGAAVGVAVGAEISKAKCISTES